MFQYQTKSAATTQDELRQERLKFQLAQGLDRLRQLEEIDREHTTDERIQVATLTALIDRKIAQITGGI